LKGKVSFHLIYHPSPSEHQKNINFYKKIKHDKHGKITSSIRMGVHEVSIEFTLVEDTEDVYNQTNGKHPKEKF
jgi:hypothetical protein